MIPSRPKVSVSSSLAPSLAQILTPPFHPLGQTVFETLVTFKPYVEAQKVSIFLSMPFGEIQTDNIVRHALSAGKDVYIPYLHESPFAPGETPPRVMDMVRLRDLPDYESLQPDKWGIPSIDAKTVSQRDRVLGEPGSESPDTSFLDLMLLPGVAFDMDGNSGSLRRLGHGKGFYDLFIRRYASKYDDELSTSKHPMLLYGLALSEQFLSQPSDSSIPVAQHDQQLHGLILGNGEIKRPADSSRSK
ncbi:5-formyltetrahydrofolate cyclo-ligase [Colletotrichum falcatum]|nr:5-formyltetrahydrofolate cyclo-ligase [Colletotrichum falcatum]